MENNKIKAAGWGAKAALGTTHNETYINPLNLKAQRGFYLVHIYSPIIFYKKLFQRVYAALERVGG